MRTFYLQLVKQGPSNFLGGIIFLALLPLCGLYALAVKVRTKIYAYKSRYRADLPVISVGNITVGGTGKTPTVDALTKYFTSRGLQVAVVSRGYAGTFTGSWGRVDPKGNGSINSAKEAGDEPFLLAMKNPQAKVYVARKRRLGVEAAQEGGAECVVLDDAFQHLDVQRDLDIVLLDGRNPFGNGFMLPAGCLREPRSALARADLFLLTHADKGSTKISDCSPMIKCQSHFADYLIDREGQHHPWSDLKGTSCLAFAGIAHPEDFFSRLRSLDFSLETLPFADHQVYDDPTIERILKASGEMDYLLTTEKDMVKLMQASFPVPCLAAPLVIEFDNFNLLEERLNRLFGANGE